MDSDSLDPSILHVDDYLRYGNLEEPALTHNEKLKEKLLKGVFYETFLKEIVVKYSVRNVSAFYSVLKFLALNIGKPIRRTDMEKYCNDLGASVSGFTIDNYLSCVVDSTMFRRILRYDINNGSFVNGGECYYCSDNGIANAILDFKNFDETALMKNAVFLKLIRKDREIYSARVGSMSVDFLAMTGDKITCIQVLPADDSKKPSKFLRPLNKLPEHIDKILISKYPVKIKSSVKNLSIADFLLKYGKDDSLYV